MHGWVSRIVAVALLCLSVIGLTVGSAVAAERGPNSFAVHRIQIDDLVGRLAIRVIDTGPVTLRIVGPSGELDRISTTVLDEVLILQHERGNFSFWRLFQDRVEVMLDVPRGMPIDITQPVSDAVIGDLDGPLHLRLARGEVRTGRLGPSNLVISGKGDITVAEVTGVAEVQIAGSGKVLVGRSDGATVRIAGPGEVHFGPVGSSLDIELSGSGGAVVDSVDGLVFARILGSGGVRVLGGRAEPLRVAVEGPGNFSFAGAAINPDLTVAGSGVIELQSYSGQPRTRVAGGGDIKLGTAIP
jgi:hypothetical protein